MNDDFWKTKPLTIEDLNKFWTELYNRGYQPTSTPQYLTSENLKQWTVTLLGINLITWYKEGDFDFFNPPKEINVTDEFLSRMPWNGIIQDGPFVFFQGRKTKVCYELIKQNFRFAAWEARLKKYECKS